MLLLRAVTRVVGILWTLVLALAGLAVGLYCLSRLVSLGAANPPRLLHLPAVRRHVGHFLDQLAAPGPTAGLALVCGLGAMAIGILLLVGLLGPRRTHLAILDGDGEGRLAARPRAVRELARALAGQADGATQVRRPRVVLSRSGRRGRLIVRAARTPTGESAEVQRAVAERLTPLTESFHLRPRIHIAAGEAGERVE